MHREIVNIGSNLRSKIPLGSRKRKPGAIYGAIPYLPTTLVSH
nr:MAG TPA: hypothetical protein [Caudoviricetes sp.]